MGIAGQGMADENGIRLVRIEPAVGLVGERHGPQGLAALQLQLIGRVRERIVLRLDDSDRAVCLLINFCASDILMKFQSLYAY